MTPDRGDLDRRLAEAAARRPGSAKGSPGGESPSGKGFLGQGLRAGLDLVTPVAVGVVLGVVFDRELATAPTGVIVGLALGLCAGALGVYRTLKGMGYAAGFRDRSKPAPERQGQERQRQQDDAAKK